MQRQLNLPVCVCSVDDVVDRSDEETDSENENDSDNDEYDKDQLLLVHTHILLEITILFYMCFILL